MLIDLQQSRFMKACRREPTDRTPIWLMRQAGRYMKKYRGLRERWSFLELCKDSDLAAEITVYAAERLGADAAIIFSDILLILEPMGFGLEYTEGGGPVIETPVRAPGDVARIAKLPDMGALSFLTDAIGKTRKALSGDLPLIGFSGAPFTLASYVIEGRGSRNCERTLAFMHAQPEAWHTLMESISESLSIYLNAQVHAGVQAVQLFDSWVGCLTPEEYRTHVLPHTKRVIDGICPPSLTSSPSSGEGMGGGVPVIHFGTRTSALLELMRDAGGDVIGIDSTIGLDATWQRLGNAAIQGNLDPSVLLGKPEEIRKQAKRILDQAAGRPGHIFNLGHGVLPDTPEENAIALVEMVHEMSAVRL
jgi:uroporphyrinogen decarboxylase